MSISTKNRRVLAIMPHPDDIEILCAGTLIRLREEAGCEIHVATMTAGDKGSESLSCEEIGRIRYEEAQLGAEVLGASSYHCLGFRDLEIVFDNPSRQTVSGLVRAVDPFLVITTPPQDYMFDHEITSQLVRDACFNASVPNYLSTKPSSGVPYLYYDACFNASVPNYLSTKPSSGVPYLYYSDAIGGHDLWGQASRVTCRIDISAQIEQKAKALMCHDSQRSWLRQQHGMDNYIESMRSWSATRGAEIGTAFGEAFSQHLGHPHPQDDILSDLLKSLTI